MSLLAIVVVTTITILVTFSSWKAERTFLEESSSFRTKVSLVLLDIGLWTPVMILVSFQLELPGSYGPVQFWAGENDTYLIMFYARIFSLLSMMFGLLLLLLTIVATIIACFRSAKAGLRLTILPVAAIVAYAFCWWCAAYFYFFPSV